MDVCPLPASFLLAIIASWDQQGAAVTSCLSRTLPIGFPIAMSRLMFFPKCCQSELSATVPLGTSGVSLVPVNCSLFACFAVSLRRAGGGPQNRLFFVAWLFSHHVFQYFFGDHFLRFCPPKSLPKRTPNPPKIDYQTLSVAIFKKVTDQVTKIYEFLLVFQEADVLQT